MTPTRTATGPSYAVVVPTVGRASLAALLRSMAAATGPLPQRVVLVDDRRSPTSQLPDPPDRLRGIVTVRRSGGRGPAAARNVGWRAVEPSCAWVVFLDDDVLVGPEWFTDVAADLDQPAGVAGVQGRVSVPLPAGRRPTDWERSTKGLEGSAWITADMAYRRPVLEQVGGFDERFPRAFREDSDLAVRVQEAGGVLVAGRRRTTHPVRPADRWVSVRVQAGNADDALMRRLHGPDWRRKAAAPRGRRPQHLLGTAALVSAAGSLAAGRRRPAAAAGTVWAAQTARFAWSRIAPGPRTRDEVTAMVLTSAVIPPVAVWHWVRGSWQHRSAPPWRPPAPVQAVLFDRDGTLVEDVPYNGDPRAVRPVPGAVDAVRELRSRGIGVGVLTNQSGIGRGLLRPDQVQRVNARIDEIFGGFDVWQVCPHTPQDGCSCRKPAPAMVRRAAAHLGVPTSQVVVIGDIGADVEAARAAGARGILVPTAQTRPEEVAAAETVAVDLPEAVHLAVGGAAAAGGLS